MELTAVFRRVPEGFIGWVEELPGANSYGATLAETHEHLLDAIQTILEANQDRAGVVPPSEFNIKEKVSLTSVAGPRTHPRERIPQLPRIRGQ